MVASKHSGVEFLTGPASILRRSRGETCQAAAVALNAWWANDSDQRYWMEIFTQPNPGNELLSPRFVNGHWSYELPSLVEPGDVVFHYSSLRPNKKSLIGWSVATGTPEVIPEYHWQARGTAGRERVEPYVGPGWRVPLGGLNRFVPVIDGDRLGALLDPLMELRDRLKEQIDGPVYFPWYRYGKIQLRAQQGYLTKFPMEIFELLPELSVVETGPVEPASEKDVVEDARAPRTRAPSGRVTRAQDPVLRSAIERRSLDVVLEHYDGLGAVDPVELGKPYDIKIALNGVERHIEVKGSSMIIDTVELTKNEVDHGQNYADSDLAVVDGIEWTRHKDGSVTTSGGRLRVWSSWSPEASSLTARTYAYLLPSAPDTRG